MISGVLAEAFATTAEDLIVVDCRLPPRVRKLGTRMIYQEAGQLLRLPASECSVRGGEYTVFDPNNIGDAIKFWMPAAERGDAKAESNLGALYERKHPPDYASAATWYAKAAQAGYAPAQVALGQLYETGRGVAKDPVRALNLYRAGAGITGGALQLVTSAGAPPATPEVEQLRRKLQERQQKIDDLEHQLQEKRGKASEADRLKRQLAELKSESARQVASLSPNSGALAKLPPPTIEIVYPLSTRGGTQLDIRLRSDGKVKQIVGRVVSPIGVKELAANGTPVAVDDQNLFTLPDQVFAPGRPVKIVATDFLGRTSAIQVSTAASASAAKPAAAPAAGELGLGRFYALIIGDDDFRYWPKIDNAVNDARAIEAVLRTRYGFETKLLVNATRQQILEAFNDYRKLGANDNLLVYYAGHGQLEPKLDRGYWIPVDAKTDDDTQWILNEQVTDYLQIIPAKRILIIADSCYSGVLTRSSVEKPEPGLDASLRLDALRQLGTRRVRTVMTSGGVQPVLDNGENGHSIFAAALLRVLQDNDQILEADRLFEAISPSVLRFSTSLGYKQTPTYRAIAYAGHEGGDFIFVPKGGG